MMTTTMMTTSDIPTTSTTTPTIKISDDESDWEVLSSIVEALESWSDRVCNLETLCKQALDFHQRVNDSLQRQLLDGLISCQDVKELEYTADLWQKLHMSFNCKVLGCQYSSEDILTFLLELYSLKQISKGFFLRVALKLTDS